MANSLPVVLLVHNEDREAAALQTLLERNVGCKISTTWSGLEALRLLGNSRFDVLLLDHYVPDLYIGDLIERASALPLPPHILILSDHSAADAIHYYESLGVCATVEREQPRAILQAIKQGSVRRQPLAVNSAKPLGGCSSQHSGAKRPN